LSLWSSKDKECTLPQAANLYLRVSDRGHYMSTIYIHICFCQKYEKKKRKKEEEERIWVTSLKGN
jgi:hypothetical protein